MVGPLRGCSGRKEDWNEYRNNFLLPPPSLLTANHSKVEGDKAPFASIAGVENSGTWGERERRGIHTTTRQGISSVNHPSRVQTPEWGGRREEKKVQLRSIPINPALCCSFPPLFSLFALTHTYTQGRQRKRGKNTTPSFFLPGPTFLLSCELSDTLI